MFKKFVFGIVLVSFTSVVNSYGKECCGSPTEEMMKRRIFFDERGGILYGKVTNKKGTAIKNATISIIFLAPNTFTGPEAGTKIKEYMNLLRLLNTKEAKSIFLSDIGTDEKGEFKIANLRPGEYAISIEAPNFQILITTFSIVHRGQELKRCFVLLPLRSTVKKGVISGKVTTEDGKPIYKALVSCSLCAKTDTSTTQMTMTSESGTYILRDVHPGKNALMVVAPGFVVKYREVIVPPGGHLKNVDFILVLGEGFDYNGE